MNSTELGAFIVERWVARGGMGDVYRGRHRATGRPVAIKRLHPSRHADSERFALEVRALRELQHETIVEYLDDGNADDGSPWLAMEWLEGEDLSKRLERGPLAFDESVVLVRRVAEALGHAHARGLLHRDLKPSNLFLVGGDVSRVKILDFGLARWIDRTRGLTSTHHVLGTVAYMAPEQARAERALDARADLYSLGVVWFEALTGKLPFSGDHAFAVLAKLLLQDAPRVRSLRREIGVLVDDLIAQTLARDPAQRPRDASAFVRALDATLAGEAITVGDAAASPSPGAPVSLRETRFGSVILVAPPDVHSSESTVDGSWHERNRGAIESLVQSFDGEATPLAGDAVIVSLSSATAPSEGAMRAAACADAIARSFPTACIALATGSMERAGKTPSGVVIDRAVAIVQDCGSAGVWTDEATARWLAPRFQLTPRGVYFSMRPGRDAIADDGDRTLLGRRTPFVGRDREMTLLDATLSECLDESVSRSILVTAPPGTGKSRLLHEFRSRVARRDGLRTLTAHGDPLSPGAAFSLARQLVRGAARLHDGDDASVQRRALEEHLAEVRAHGDREYLFDPLAELAGIVSSERDPSRDPDRDRERAGIALTAWLDAVCAKSPVLFVLEDLHWGDAASVDHLVRALRRNDERACMLVAFARPEVRNWLPDGRLASETLEIPLEGLTRRAAERLARAVLEDDATDDLVRRIVERADGNAFHLEELIRRAVEWGDDDLPDTVFALLQSRLDAIGPEPRRALRAASVFGERFWVSGVQRLVGHGDKTETASLLDQLATLEVIEVIRASRFPGEHEYSFRHALLRDAAYATLADSDRAAAHRLAGEWLVESGEHQPELLATHFERGGDLERAVPWILQAAEVAFIAYQLNDSLDLARRGIEYGATGLVRGRFYTIVADILTWQSDPEGARRAALEGFRLCERGGPHWFLCASLVVLAATNQNSAEDGAMEVLQGVLTLDRAPEPTGRCAFAIAMLQYGLFLSGQRELMEAIVGPLRAAARSPLPHDGEFTSWLEITEGYVALYVNHRPGEALRRIRAGSALSVVSKAVAGVEGRGHLATVEAECGLYEDALRTIDEWIEAAKLRGLDWMVNLAISPTVRALTAVGRYDEAIARGEAGIDDPVRANADATRFSLAAAYFAAGRLDEAASCANALLETEPVVVMRIPALIVLARVHGRRGEWNEAFVHADAAVKLLETAAAPPYQRYGAPYVRARALKELGRGSEAHDAYVALRTTVDAAIATIEGTRDRDAFCAIPAIREILDERL